MLSVLFRRSNPTPLFRVFSVAAKELENGLKDPFLQPIDPASCLKNFPDYSVIQKCNEELKTGGQDRFAVIQLGSHQFKVMNEDLIYLERIPALSVNDEIHLHKLLVWASLDQTILGRPFLPGGYVHALVEEQCEDAAVFVFKKKRRKRYRRTKQHRQGLTGIRILRICDVEELLKQSPIEEKLQEQ